MTKASPDDDVTMSHAPRSSRPPASYGFSLALLLGVMTAIGVNTGLIRSIYVHERELIGVGVALGAVVGIAVGCHEANRPFGVFLGILLGSVVGALVLGMCEWAPSRSLLAVQGGPAAAAALVAAVGWWLTR